MKLTTFILFVTLMQVSAAGFAQKITLNAHNASLEQVFKDIRKQTGYDFIYTGKLISKANPVTIQLKDASIEDALKECFADQPLDYTIDQKTVIIKEKQPAQQTAPAPPKDVTGHVTDKQGVALVNATVLLKRTKSGTLTDVKGNFTLRGVLPDDIITVTYIGYKPLSIKVGNETVFNLVMEETTNALDAVVVQAYGKTSQRFATGDIGTVSGADIAKQPVMNPLLALFGKVPGLEITQNSGYASANVGVTIRGRANIGGPSDPLFIVDGVPLTLNGSGANNGSGALMIFPDGSNLVGPAGGQSQLFAINPADIESISVLKDADATSIYGSRGADGVIIITTKKGKAGKTKLEGSLYQGVQEVTQRYPMLNTQQYIQMRLEAFRNDGITPTTANAYDLLTWGKGYTDFQKEFWGGLGKTIDPEVNLSGGNNLTTFSLSGGYHHETSIFNYSGAEQRASFHVNINHKSLNERLNISFTSSYSYTVSDLKQLPSNVANAPNAPPIFDANGDLNFSGWQPSHNFYFESLLQPYKAGTNSLNSNLNISYQLIKDLIFTTNFGYSTQNVSNYGLQPIVSQNPLSNPTGNSSFSRSVNGTTIIEPQLDYKKLIGKNTITALIGGTTESDNLNGVFLSGQGYTDDNLLRSIGNAPSKYVTDGYYEYKYVSVFSRLNYNFDNKYIVNLTATRDGSSRFGPGKQFGNFASVGAAWIFSEENWVKNHLDFLSFGKLRGSYGLTGSDQISDYQYLTRITSNGTIPYQSGPSYVPTQLANPDLHWQTNKKLEAAIDLGFLKDRLTINISVYKNRISDQLVGANLSTITGFSSVTENFPATVQNSGIEGTLNFKVIDRKDFDWTINFDVGRGWNKLVAFPNLKQSPYGSFLTIGQSLTTSYLLHYTGINPQTGLYTFQDKNKDGQLVSVLDVNRTLSDLYPVDLSQKLAGGFSSDFIYKGWELDLYFNFKTQTLPGSLANTYAGEVNTNQSTQVLNRWQYPGDITQYPKFTTTGSDRSYQNFRQSDGAFSDGSYIKLRNAVLSYDLPAKWVKKIGMQRCKINITAQNFLTFTKYNGVDPDVAGFGTTLPPAKIITGGIQFTY